MLAQVSFFWGGGGIGRVNDRGQTGFYHFLRSGDNSGVLVYDGAEFLLDIADKDGRISF